MSKLTKLIKALSDPGRDFSDLPDHPLVVKTLEELHGMAGNDDLKNQIASQISHLLTMRHKKNQKIMLNTILYGPPGVGKTQIGQKLAKIWYGLGYLKATPIVAVKTIEDEEETQKRQQLLIGFLVMLFAITAPLIKTLYSMLGLYLCLVTLIALLTLIWWYLGTDKIYDYYDKYVTPVISDQASPAPTTSSDLVTVVSREDFVGKYVGWTDKKTKELLENNRGKVLFIDEAYSLVLSPRDQYGIEAVTTLNRYLSEHPGEIIVIFAGYKDRMQTVFEQQPGLIRRCMWHFEINPYSPDQLFSIFESQLQQQGWSLEDPDEVKTVFRKHPKAFPNFGGDTERLCNFALLQYSEDNLGEGTGQITTDQVRRGLDILQQNNIVRDVKPKSRLEQLLEGN